MKTLLQQFYDQDMPKSIKDTLVGNLLGDGSVQPPSPIAAKFALAQSSIHKEYILFLFAIYTGYTTRTELSFRTFVDSRSGNTHSAFYFSLESSPIIGILRNIFYQGNIKIIR